CRSRPFFGGMFWCFAVASTPHPRRSSSPVAATWPGAARWKPRPPRRTGRMRRATRSAAGWSARRWPRATRRPGPRCN
ncbi:MAG: hypothetical protein AVDCRST_MAG39-1323, partial [uncultured Sphingomonadaceae bacterium]